MTDKNYFDFDKTPAIAEHYERGLRWFVPGYDASHAVAAVLIHDHIGERGRVLVLGAGGGLELSALAQASPGWTFVGVDPSEYMLAQALRVLRDAGVEDRVQLVRGTISDAPAGPFDAATCFLTLHIIPDDGARLETLGQIRRRLEPGAPFLMINFSADKASPKFEQKLRTYRAFARRNGAPEDMINSAAATIRDHMPVLSPAREEALLREAGFGDIELFYVGMTFRGWIAHAV